MTQTRRRFSESFKLEAVDQVLAGTPIRHVTETLGIAGCLLGKWKRQYEQQGDDAFPGNSRSVARVRSCTGYASNWLRSPWSAMY
ncbi:hypothetical protein SRABI70_00410 [Pseudomonas sp. Bi70]|uniref:transposase n=1 Tax=Pseudomonas sp. Bi70 TaxID=2821127 RepID=UPI001DAEB802|nr:transposase [Pseudomonas sp. Bi70]CAH0146217.1 hypothetical protein SRABI70_00410 [Pseudomonas sp. Bi70]